MLRVSLRRWMLMGAGVALVAGLLDPGVGLAHAAQGPVPASVPTPFPPRGAVTRRAEGRSEGAGGWWLGTAGIALALAACGGISLATRRNWPRTPQGGGLRVVGRTSLSPKHTVHLLSVGGRVLIVGTGPQGSPSLLGELTDPDDLRRLVPGRESDDQTADGPSVLGRVSATWRRPAGEDR